MLTGQNLKLGHSHRQSRRRKCLQAIRRQISYLRREMRWSLHSYYRMTLNTNTGSRDQKVLKLCVEVTPPVPRTVTLAASCLTTIKQVRHPLKAGPLTNGISAISKIRLYILFFGIFFKFLFVRVATS